MFRVQHGGSPAAGDAGGNFGRIEAMRRAGGCRKRGDARDGARAVTRARSIDGLQCLWRLKQLVRLECLADA